MSYIWWLGSRGDLNCYFIKIVPACVLLNDNGRTEHWVMILLCWTLHMLLPTSTHRCVHTFTRWLVTFRLDFSRHTKYYTQFRFRSIHKKTGNHLRHQINLTLPALTRLDTLKADVCLLCVGLSFASSHFKSKTKLVRQKGTKTVFILVLYELTLLIQYPNPLSLLVTWAWAPELVCDTCQGPQH